jgi:hypothetical protein
VPRDSIDVVIDFPSSGSELADVSARASAAFESDSGKKTK